MKKFLMKINTALHIYRGEGYVDTIVKIIICIVVGALLLMCIYNLIAGAFDKTSLRVNSMFTYLGSANGPGEGSQPQLTAPTELSITGDTLSWTGSSGATGYKVYRDGEVFDMTLDNSYDLSVIITEGTYNITVGALAEGYQESVPSDAISYTTAGKTIIYSPEVGYIYYTVSKYYESGTYKGYVACWYNATPSFYGYHSYWRNEGNDSDNYYAYISAQGNYYKSSVYASEAEALTAIKDDSTVYTTFNQVLTVYNYVRSGTVLPFSYEVVFDEYYDTTGKANILYLNFQMNASGYGTTSDYKGPVYISGLQSSELIRN